MAFGYPVLLELTGRRTVVIGDVAVEAGKVEGLLAAGAEVTVVAKGPEAALDRLEADPKVTVHRRGYRGPSDVSGAVLCVAHAAEPGVRDAIAADALAAGVRAELSERFGPDWTELVEVVGRVRADTLPHLPDFEDRSRRWRSALDLAELEGLIAAGQGDLAATRLRDRLLEGVA
jgi:siroheme synthase (precorrin-2 oxidase/ferrochelatase)